MSAKRCKRIFEKWFSSDEEANEYYLDLCEQYWEVKLLDVIDHEDGSVTCRWSVTE